MAVDIIGDERGAAFYSTTDNQAFGPVYQSRAEALDFLKWLNGDPRDLSNKQALNPVYNEWRQTIWEDDA